MKSACVGVLSITPLTCLIGRSPLRGLALTDPVLGKLKLN